MKPKTDRCECKHAWLSHSTTPIKSNQKKKFHLWCPVCKKWCSTKGMPDYMLKRNRNLE